MLRWIKDAFGKKESPAARIVSFDEIPSALDTVSEDALRDLEIRARPHIEEILAIREQLQNQVKELARAERTEKIHPKLEKITKNSLPQFEKAIATSLAHSLPSDPEEFYKAFTESLKGCVKGLAGPGRYLRNVFPDEMKTIRILVDEMGNGMNNLTPLVAARRTRKEQIAALRDVHHRISVQSEIKTGAIRAIPPLEARLAETERTLAERERQLLEQTGSIEEITSLAELEKEHGVLKQRKTDNEREIGTITSALAHVFRKAEKITHRDDAGSLAKQIRITTEFLTGAEIPDVTDLASMLTPVLPSIVSLVGSGEIQLKNQEEKRLFVNPDRIPVILSDLHTSRKETLELTGQCEQKIQEHPLTRRKVALMEEIAGLKNQMNNDRATLTDLRSRVNDSESTLPDLRNRLEEGLSILFGGPVKVNEGG